MKVRRNIWKIMTLPVLPFLIFTGCATSIKLEVERPPNLNTSGIRRIAVMPFEAAGGSPDIAQYATTVATDRIRAMNHFTLVDPSTIEQLRRSGQNIENHVDALFVGRVTRTASANSTQQGSYKNRDGQVVTYTNYITEVEVEFNYSLSMARDGRLIGPISRRGTGSASAQQGYPNASQLMRSTVDRQLSTVGRDLAPHKVIENRTFAVDKSGNEAVKAAMNSALAQVKAGNYKVALDAYLKIYERHKSSAAAENASILHETFGDTKAAADLMQQVVNNTGNPKAREVLDRLNKILQDQAAIASEYDDTRSPTDRVAAFASEEIRKTLPQEALVWFYNNSPGNTMVEAVADNITADFIRNQIGVVDRQNAALIEAEQKLHMSGAVSDADIVGIGNAAGANTIVIIGLTGTGAMRRLQVRVLDIKRGIPIMQSDTGERWQL